MRRVWGSVVAVAAVSLVGFAGCGGEAAGPSDEDEIRTALVKAFTDRDPSDCSDLFTEQGLDALNVTPADSLTDCQEDAEGEEEAASAEVSDIEVDGSHAQATVTGDDGDLAGANLELELVDDDGWKIDGVGDYEIFDRDQFIAAAELPAMEEGSLGYTSFESACTRRYLETEVPLETIEQTFATQNVDYVYEALIECVGDGSIPRLVGVILQRNLEADGTPSKLIACILRRARPAFRITLEEFAQGSSTELKVAIASAARACGVTGPTA